MAAALMAGTAVHAAAAMAVRARHAEITAPPLPKAVAIAVEAKAADPVGAATAVVDRTVAAATAGIPADYNSIHKTAPVQHDRGRSV